MGVMALDARVFGRPAPSQVAKDVMSSASLSALPAPSQPADLVEQPNLANYYNAYSACSEILRLERDLARRMKVQEFHQFVDETIQSMEPADTSAVPPAPMPQPAMPPNMPQAGPQAAALGGSLPGMSPQGVMPQVPTPSAPAMA